MERRLIGLVVLLLAVGVAGAATYKYREGKRVSRQDGSVLAVYTPPSLTREMYDKVVKRQYETGVFPHRGLDMEVVFGEGDKMKVQIVYDSMDSFQSHGEKILPIFREFNFDPGEPSVFPLYNRLHRGE
jgi:hypothetical protein